MTFGNNIITLVRLGFLPPEITYKDLKKTLYYKIWKHFSLVCVHAEFESFSPPKIFCKKLNAQCSFENCPILKNALQDFERKRKVELIDEE